MQSNMVGLSKQIAVLPDVVQSSKNKMSHITNILQDQMSKNTKMLQGQITASEGRLQNNISTLQKDVNIFQAETNARFN